MRPFILLVLLLAVSCQRPPAPASGGAVRVVSLAPSLTEIIYAIGAADCLVGRSSACKYPAAVTNVPVAGDFGIPSHEVLATLGPTAVLSVDLEDKNSTRTLERLGIQHHSVPCRSLDEIPAAIRKIGQITRHDAAAETLAADFANQLAKFRQEPSPARRPRVFVEIWGDPIMTAGKRAFLTELIALAGGENITGDVDRDFFQVSPEVILARNPEVILLLEEGKIDVTKRSGWSELAAVKSNRVVRTLDRDLLEIPGPRVLQAVDQLRRCWP